MRLAELIDGLPLAGGDGLPDVEVQGIRYDSRRVEPGDLFVAVPGQRAEGRRYATQAVAAGAVAVVASGPPLDGPAGVPWLVGEDPRRLMATLAARLYRRPDRELVMLGVTGTNGKSTTVWLLQAVMDAAGLPTGIIGTVGSHFRELPLATARTTPEAPDLFHLLRQLRLRGAEAAAMEVSSHSLVLGRVAEVRYEVAVFTHLTRDHLDFHGTMEEYFQAKRRLFQQLGDQGVGVVNAADPWGRRLVAELDRVVTFGEGGAVCATGATFGLEGIRARLATPRGELEISSRLVGHYNLDNILGAVATAEALALPQPAIAEGIAALDSIPGRMERIDAGQDFPVFLDYAHTPDALARLYRSVREMTGRRIVAVFGAPGQRDRGKRPLMGRVAAELADFAVLTSDNPRDEDPAEIAAQLASGFEEIGAQHYAVVPDRAAALREAVRRAGPDAVLLVTGKGAETGQEIGGATLDHSDREVLEESLRTASRA